MLTFEQIENCGDDVALFRLLAAEASALLPPELQHDRIAYFAFLPSLPPGIRAFNGIWDLDVSMSMDDIALHFTNHSEEGHLQETLWSLAEVEANEVHSIFSQALSIVRPHLEELRSGSISTAKRHEWLNTTGIQSACQPLNKRLWEICEEAGHYRLLSFAISHARNRSGRFT